MSVFVPKSVLMNLGKTGDNIFGRCFHFIIIMAMVMPNNTRQDKTTQDDKRQYGTRQDNHKTTTRQDKTRQDKTRQDKTRQDKAS